jgi:hypothetical protein
MNKPYPALCRDCKYAMPEPGSTWNMRCINPRVNARNEWALANTGGDGTPAHSDCRSERGIKWFAACGITGKLWEPKPSTPD